MPTTTPIVRGTRRIDFTMQRTKQKKLQAAGWRVGSAADFLELTAEEAALVEIRLRLARSLRSLRKKHHMTQESMAKRLGSSQSRIAKMGKADPSVSLELMVRSAVALGPSAKDVGQAISGGSI